MFAGLMPNSTQAHPFVGVGIAFRRRMKREIKMDKGKLCQHTNISAKPVKPVLTSARKCLTRPSTSAPRAADTFIA